MYLDSIVSLLNILTILRRSAAKAEIRSDVSGPPITGCAGDQVYKTAKQIDPGLNVIVIRVTRTVRRWTGSYRSVPYGFKKPLKIEQLIQTVKILGRTTVMVEP